MINQQSKIIFRLSAPILVAGFLYLASAADVNAQTCRWVNPPCNQDPAASCRVNATAAGAGGTYRATITNSQGNGPASCSDGTSCQAPVGSTLSSSGSNPVQFTCTCTGPAGYSETIRDWTCPPQPACSNGSDDDGDGFTDYPNDIGCSGLADTDESNPVPPTADIINMFTPSWERLTSQGWPVGTIAGTAAASAGTIQAVNLYIREKNDPNPGCNSLLDRDWTGTAWIAACQAAGMLTPATVNPSMPAANVTWTYTNTPQTSQMIGGKTYRVYVRSATDTNNPPQNSSGWIPEDAVFDASSLPLTLVLNGPTSGAGPFNASLTATVTGGSGNSMNYSFWWNCSHPSANVSTVIGDASCGSPTPNLTADCADSVNGNKCDAQSATSRTVTHTFNGAGIYVVKVIIERGSDSGTAYATVRVTGDTQSAWQVQLVRISGGVVYDSGQQSGGATSHLVTGQGFAFNNAQHYAQVRVWDAAGAPSNWVRMSICNDYTGQVVLCDASETSFNSGLRFPEPAFTFSPANPAPNQSIQFNGTSSRCYDASGGVIPCTIFNWSFGNANPGTASGPIANTMFTVIGGNTVNLDVGTSAGVCSLDDSTIIQVTRPVPIWKEVIPFDISK